MADVPVTPILSDYLARVGRLQFRWGGEIDCWLFGCGWVRACTNVDPLRAFHGSYTARERRRIIRDYGGTPEFTERMILPLGYVQTDDPAGGDVGLVWAANKRFHGKVILVHASAICVRPRLWAIKPADGGLVLADFPIVRAWTLSSHGRNDR